MIVALSLYQQFQKIHPFKEMFNIVIVFEDNPYQQTAAFYRQYNQTNENENAMIYKVQFHLKSILHQKGI